MTQWKNQFLHALVNLLFELQKENKVFCCSINIKSIKCCLYLHENDKKYLFSLILSRPFSVDWFLQ